MCAGVALAMGSFVVAASISVREWHPSALVRMSGTEPAARLARQADPSFAFVNQDAHYDGVYYYTVARDPLARGEPHRLIDAPAYRYGHAGYGWLAGALSLGRARLVPAALLVLGLLGMAAAGWSVSSICSELGWSAWGGLFVAFHPGLLYAVTVDTSEAVGLAVLSLAFLAWTRRRWSAAAFAMVAACLIKEPFVLLPVGLGIWELVLRLRGHRAAELAARICVLAAGPAALAVWMLYLRLHLGVWPFRNTPGHFFEIPLFGWIRTVRDAAPRGDGSFDQIAAGAAAVPVLAATLGALLVGTARAKRLRVPTDAIFLLFALGAFCLNPLSLFYVKDMFRELVVPLLMLPAVLCARPAPPLAHDGAAPLPP